MRSNTAWVLVVLFSLLCGYFGYTVWHDLVSGPVNFATFFAMAMVGVGAVVIWQCLSYVSRPRAGLIVSLSVFLAFLFLSLVYGYFWSNPSGGGLSGSFYVTDQWGNSIKASPRAAFNLFDLWTGGINLGSRFTIDYDCTVRVSGTSARPDSLTLTAHLDLLRAFTHYTHTHADHNFNPVGTAYAPSGWIDDGGGNWHIDVGKGGAPRVSPWSFYAHEDIWNDYSSYTFTVSLTATVTAAGVTVRSDPVSASFLIEKKTQFSVSLEDVNIGPPAPF